MCIEGGLTATLLYYIKLTGRVLPLEEIIYEYEETVKTLIVDAKSLQAKFTALQEKNDFRGALDAMRLLKDTLSLIKEYDWELKYSEYQTDGHKEVAVWEQNHSGEIRNHKKWVVSDDCCLNQNRWYKMFEDYITSGKSCIVDNGDKHRNTGKSYALAQLCDKYKGVIVHKKQFRPMGIENADKKLGIVNTFVPYKEREFNLRQYKDKIIFIDEGSGLFDDEIEKIKKNNIVIGFR